MHAWQAIILGIVEGLTEYLPVSSTGHLILAQRALGIEDTAAAKAYAIVIQFGAILAVLGLYWARVRQMARGVIGQDHRGRQLLINLIAAFIPAAAIGFLFKKQIDQHLLKLWPITFAWLVGGLAILAVTFWRGRGAARGGRPLESLDWSMALLIGWFQVLGMWPGTSRSLITIVGGLIVGLSMAATLEFSFLLGLITLTAASAYEAWKERHGLAGTIGISNILIGLLFSGIFAAISIKWMVEYLRRHGLAVFGWYRVALAVVVTALLLVNVLKAEGVQLDRVPEKAQVVYWETQSWETGGPSVRITFWSDGRSEIMHKGITKGPPEMRTGVLPPEDVKKRFAQAFAGGILSIKEFQANYSDGSGYELGYEIDGKVVKKTIPEFPRSAEGSPDHIRFVRIRAAFAGIDPKI